MQPLDQPSHLTGNITQIYRRAYDQRVSRKNAVDHR